MAKSLEVTDEDELSLLKEYNLLTYKPVIYAANVSEDDLADDGASNEMVAKVREFAASENSEVFVICAQIEEEISELDDDEKAMFLDDLGLKESGLEKLIKASYHILGLNELFDCRRGLRPEHGPSRSVPRRLRQPVRFTPISREASSRRKL